MKGNTLLGLFIIAVGVVFLGNRLEIWDANVFFDGWWTLFIIVPSLISVLKREFISGFIGLSIGMFLLLVSNNIISWQLVGPLFLIVVGIVIIFGQNKVEFTKIKSDYLAIFSGSENKIVGDFTETSATALFGGVDLDLRNATVKDGACITCSCLFGGIDIIVPDNVQVVVKGTPIFGGIENKVSNKSDITLTVDCICVFGGIDIK